jgi:nucleoside-diphosphate-sugar epimerase
MEGKNCIVTGANSGIGYAIAEGLASRYEILHSVIQFRIFPKTTKIHLVMYI